MADNGIAGEANRKVGWPMAVRGRIRSGPARLYEVFLAERARWPLWLPVMLGLGIGVYFALPIEPPAWIAAVFAVAAVAVVILARHAVTALPFALALLAVAVGFAVADLRTGFVGGSPLEVRLGPGPTQGRVVKVEILPGARRLLLEDVRRPDLTGDTQLGLVRIRTRANDPLPWPGDWVSVRAQLAPPSPPVAPGAFDFQRHAYFKGIGAVGFARGPIRLIDAPSDAAASTWRIPLERFRQSVYGRVLAQVEGAEGAIAAALLTGERGAIPEDVLVAMRNSGLAHLLAISGLHVGLLAGILFFGIRGLLALVEPVALRYPIKKWAAVGALAGAFGYLLLTGAPVPTQRAFLMLALVLVAVLLDRTAISMRLVAWAALIVLLTAPESLLGASFQMSFAAVVALVAAYEASRNRWSAWRRDAGWRAGLLYLSGVAMTTLVASAATAPFAAFHFNRLAVYGLAANLIAVPVTGLWIMPWALVAMGLMPFGADAWALRAMAAGIDVVVTVAREVSGWPGAVALVRATPVSALVVIALGGLWLCLWRRRWRLFGVPVMALGLALGAWRSEVPDILVSGDGRLMAVKNADGRLSLSTRRVARFAGDIWLRRAGQGAPLSWPREGPGPDGRLACDSLGCIYRAGGHVVALEKRTGARPDDCAVADIVVSAVPVRGPCPSARLIIDRFDLWREGAHAIWFDGQDVRVDNVRRVQGARPWVTAPIRRQRRQPAK